MFGPQHLQECPHQPCCGATMTVGTYILEILKAWETRISDNVALSGREFVRSVGFAQLLLSKESEILILL